MRNGVFRSEWGKFFTYHWCIVGVISAALLPPLTLLFTEKSSAGSLLQSSDVIALCLRFLYLGQAGIIIAMAGFCGQEYSGSYLRTTLLTNSSRMKLLLTKKIIITVITIITGILSSILCIIVIIIKYQYVITFDLFIRFITTIPLAIISWVVLGLISGYISIITKSLIVPIAILFPLILGLSQMLLAITELAKYLPDLAGMNLFLLPEQKPFLTLWIGLIVQLIWIISLDCISTYLFQNRDVR